MSQMMIIKPVFMAYECYFWLLKMGRHSFSYQEYQVHILSKSRIGDGHLYFYKTPCVADVHPQLKDSRFKLKKK